MRTFILVLLAACLTYYSQVSAQNNAPLMQIEAGGLPTATGSVMLRWAPVDFKTFEWGIAHGYKVYRSPLAINNVPVSAGDALEITTLAAQLKPWTQPAWEVLMNADSTDWPDLGAGAIYGDDFTVIDPDTADIMDVVDQNREQQNRFSFGLYAAEQSFTVACAMGLALVDSTAQPNSTYRYIIELADAPSGSAKKAQVIVNTGDIPVLPVPALTIESGDRQVTLRWERANLEKFYNSYVVERSDNGGQTFSRLNDLPVVFVSDNDIALDAFYFTDSIPQNNVQYQYRVFGITTFGLNGPYSNIASVTGQPGPLDGIDIPVTVTEVGQGDMKIEWTVSPDVAAKISSFDVLRATDIGADFYPLNAAPLANSVTEYIDEYPNPANYYVVIATDLNGHAHRSIAKLGQPEDSTPPAAPAGLTCTCDKNGKVSLQWSPSISNDVMGYRVFMSNNNNKGDMQQITADWIPETQYQHMVEMNTLSENVFFAVKAVDFRQNTSAYSAPCGAARPDVIPPAAPVIKEYTFIGGQTRFTFLPSSSDDVTYYVFERRVKSYVDWEVLATIHPVKIGEPFTDTSAFNRWRYEYRLTAYDEVNLAGSSSILEVKPYDDGLRGAIVNLQGHQLLSTPTQGFLMPGAVLLTWDYPAVNDPDLMGFQVMRAVGGDPLRSLAFLSLAKARLSSLQIPGSNVFQAEFGFLDFDVKQFKQLIQQGSVLVPPGGGGTAVPTGPAGVGVTYTVFAKYVDGAMSPVSTVVVWW